jgi:histone deacetylase 6
VSLHRYDNGSFYPGSDEADPSYTGLNAGQGHNINIAWSKVSHWENVCVGEG